MPVGPVRGRLIAFEGIDGCGKSTQAALAAASFGAALTFEPGGTPLGAALRPLALGTAQVDPVARAEALLMMADRAQHVADVIEPALATGRWVVTDRFGASTLAYQGHGRGLDLGILELLNRWATAGVAPDLNVLIDLPVVDALARRHQRVADGFESLDTGFHQRVAAGFRSQAASDPEHWLVVDGRSGPDEVAAAVAAGVAERLGAPGQLGDDR